MKFSIHRLALAELTEAYRFYDEAADDFRAEVLRLIANILKFPTAFPKYQGTVRKAVLRKFPFSLFYQVTSDQIRILAVAHHKRRPGYWEKRS